MREITDYRAGCRIVLGDETGRRYYDSTIDMGFREALPVYRSFCPLKTTIFQRVAAVDGVSVTLSGFLDPAAEILTVRNEAGYWLEFGEYRTEQKVYLNIYGGQDVPGVEEKLSLGLSLPHRIKGLDEARETTIPAVHEFAVIKGAAGYAMRIRARSVTEVFGKRPEDRAALMEQAEQLITEYFSDLARLQPAVHDPLPRGNFPI